MKKFEQKSARKSEGGNWREISTKIGGINMGNMGKYGKLDVKISGKVITKIGWKIIGKIVGKIGGKNR